MTILTTPRLRLEPITDAHFDGLYALNSIPAVMRYIASGRPETPADTRAMIERVMACWAQYGFSWWAFIERESGQLIGAGCIQHLGRDPANPLEIGWRLRPEKWGQGFASEAAREMARFAFENLAAELLCAVCDPANLSSSKVMERLGMHYTGRETWYEREVSMYQMSRAQWLAAKAR